MLAENILDGPPPLYQPRSGGLGYEMFRMMKMNKGRTAQYVIETGEATTYDEVLERTIRVSLHLLRRKLKKEDVVCLCSHNQLHSAIPFFASKFIDVNYASIEPSMSEEDLIYLFQYLKPKVLFVADSAEDKVENCLREANAEAEIIIFGKSEKNKEFDDFLEPIPNEESFTPVIVDDLMETAIIFLSSGTTGKPKGICCNHYSLLAKIGNLAESRLVQDDPDYIDLTQTTKTDEILPNFFTYSPMYWISGISLLIMAVIEGAIRTIGATFNAETAWNAIEKFKPSVVFLPPGQVVDLYLTPRKNPENEDVKVFITGGGPVKAYHLEYLKKMFPKVIPLQMYGITETTGMVTSFNIRDPKEAELQFKYPSSCGKLTHGVSAKVIDPDTEQVCGINEQGELRIMTQYIMNGYYKMDTSSAFDSQGWFKTGDLAFFNEEKCLTIVDRLKELILYTLYNIRPSVIEDILAQHPSVHESFVIGIPHPRDNEHPMGIVLLKQNYKNKVSDEEILKFVNERVPADRYKIRAGIKIVEEIIKSPSGKIKKLAMKHLIIDGKF